MNDNVLELILELQEKAAKLDSIIRYVTTAKYSPDKDIILAIAGETEGDEE